MSDAPQQYWVCFDCGEEMFDWHSGMFHGGDIMHVRCSMLFHVDLAKKSADMKAWQEEPYRLERMPVPLSVALKAIAEARTRRHERLKREKAEHLARAAGAVSE